MDERLTIHYNHFSQQLVEAMPWPMLIIDAGFKVVYGNRQVGPLFGYKGKIVGRRLGQLLDDTAILQLIEASIEAGSIQCGEFDRAGTGGAWKVSVTPIEHRETGHERRRVSKNQREQEHAEMEPDVKPAGATAARPAYHYFSVVIEDL